MLARAHIIALCGVALVSGANAASLQSTTQKDGKVIVELTGSIAAGDSAQLEDQIRSANAAKRVVYAVRLNSPGGSLLEGVKLAVLIRNGKIATSVTSGSKCASACFIAFAAGTEKFVHYSGAVGVHGASDKSGREVGDATVSMARIAKELGVPAGIIGKMVVTRPKEILWLSPDDLRSMGAKMTGTPNQLPQTAQPSTSAAPNQLGASSPNAPMQLNPLAILTPGSQSLTWDDLVKGGIALSRQQNGGNSRIGRTCQPEHRICVMGVFFRGKDDNDILLRAVENQSGTVVRREVCIFNKFKDVRTCMDWGTKAMRRDMKDQKGEWVKVAGE
jgi:hypothetical protein